ncbi:unnamed protein product [Tetraodon nigroviridis]|uniref:Chromosome 10 SCAF15019, whole genome shotgun sequence n=1 Tax=Tetraodon nigroviridis TaxID=99883 RepID=Q4RLZ2_TETNG|nr:unnamed protein product [Tetraodon nigroviridis]
MSIIQRPRLDTPMRPVSPVEPWVDVEISILNHSRDSASREIEARKTRQNIFNRKGPDTKRDGQISQRHCLNGWQIPIVRSSEEERTLRGGKRKTGAPRRPKLKVAQHLCHVGLSELWAGGQGQGNSCIASECLDLCPQPGGEFLGEKDRYAALHLLCGR